MKHLSFLLTNIFIIILLFSCGSENKTPLENKLQYKLVTYQKQTEGCDEVRDDQCTKIKIEFPQITSFENNIVKEKINRSIASLFSSEGNGTEENDFIIEMENFIKEYESFINNFPEAFQFWFVEKTGEVKLNKGNIFSIDFMEYSYTGGAHPRTFVAFKNFNLTNGEEIRLEDIIPEDKLNELTKAGESIFRKLKELSEEADLGEAGFWFENNEFYLNDNFLITDKSLVFYYNNYEIASYAYGPTELEIPYSQIKGLLKENSLVANFIQ